MKPLLFKDECRDKTHESSKQQQMTTHKTGVHQKQGGLTHK